MSYTGLCIAVDFDGTCVTHEYPYLGQDIGAVPVLRELAEQGHKLILYTMRSGKLEKEAIEWFKQNDIPLYAVNTNPSQKKWTKSPKVHADVYIDDSALGVPLIHSMTTSRPYVDWVKVREWLVAEGFL
ncbi:MAG: HAD family hydrolase [Alistipes sp.]|nr:HAD family hydrolase [Alistipes sp.]